MSAKIITFPKDAVTVKEHHAITTSLAVAQVFGKQHKDVLKAARNLECSNEFRRRNFAPSSYINEQGKAQPMYEITRRNT